MSSKALTKPPRKTKAGLSQKVRKLVQDAAPPNGRKKAGGNGTSGSGRELGNGSLSEDRYLLEVLTGIKNGNFNVRMPIDRDGVSGKICDTINDIISLNEKMMLEFTKAGNT